MLRKIEGINQEGTLLTTKIWVMSRLVVSIEVKMIQTCCYKLKAIKDKIKGEAKEIHKRRVRKRRAEDSSIRHSRLRWWISTQYRCLWWLWLLHSSICLGTHLGLYSLLNLWATKINSTTQEFLIFQWCSLSQINTWIWCSKLSNQIWMETSQ